MEYSFSINTRNFYSFFFSLHIAKKKTATIKIKILMSIGTLINRYFATYTYVYLSLSDAASERKVFCPSSSLFLITYLAVNGGFTVLTVTVMITTRTGGEEEI
jgi:hypothetical protein